MLQQTTDDRIADGPEQASADSRRHAALGPAVARLCQALESGDVIAVACSEQRGEAIAKAVAALSPALVLWCPPSDVLPGEDAPASPAIAGRRVAALAALQARGERPVLLVTDATSAAQKLAPPADFAAKPFIVEVGQPLDGEALAEALEAIGYFRDDRVDEPGEIAIRSGAIDLFLSDTEQPVRIHLEEGKVDRIGAYNAVTQLGGRDEIERLVIHPAAEPPLGPEPVTLFDHLPDAAVAIDPEAPDRRDRFIELAADTPAAKAQLARAADWKRAFKGRTLFELAEADEQPGQRFVEARSPERAFLAAFQKAREQGDRIVIAGSSRNIRFFSRRLEQRIGEAPLAVSEWTAVETAGKGALLTLTAELERGWSEPGLLVVAAADVLGARALDSSRTSGLDPLSHEIADFHIGDAIIHEDHGLGVLRGVESITTHESPSDAIRLEYAAEAQRLVPIEEADRLWRYGAEAEAVALDRLDGSSWQKRRAEIDATIADTARQLVALAEERAARTAPELEPDVSSVDGSRVASTI